MRSMTDVRVLSVGSAVDGCSCGDVRVFVWIIFIVIEEGSTRGSRCLTSRFLKITVKGFLLTPTVEVACQDENER